MPVPANAPAMHPHTVMQIIPESMETIRCRLMAAYLTESGSYTLFKDSGHDVVAAFQTALVTRIERGDCVSDDSV